MRERLDAFFSIAARGSSITTEVRAGVTTFLTMAYILAVNPQILKNAGMPVDDVAIATALAAAAATLIMGCVANFPFALAPGMGLNAYFAFGVVIGMDISWQVALAAVFIEGHCVPEIRGGPSRAAQGPGRAVPLPCVAQSHTVTCATAIKEGYAVDAVVGHGVPVARRRSLCASQRPSCAVPFPRVALIPAFAVSSKQHSHATGAVID